MNSITRAMKYRQFLLTYAQKYGVSCASRKYNRPCLINLHACHILENFKLSYVKMHRQ